MKQIDAITLDVLVTEEKLLRQEMNNLAEKYDYLAIVFNPAKDIMGESVRTGLNSRWLNILRLIHLMKTGTDSTSVMREFRSDDPVLRRIWMALPEA
jgi:hypothetical protein